VIAWRELAEQRISYLWNLHSYSEFTVRSCGGLRQYKKMRALTDKYGSLREKKIYGLYLEGFAHKRATKCSQTFP
jgi:hypothetical protein